MIFYLQLLKELHRHHHVSHHHADQMLNVEKRTELVLVFVSKATKEIHMIAKEDVEENAKSILIVNRLLRASLSNVLILVRELVAH